MSPFFVEMGRDEHAHEYEGMATRPDFGSFWDFSYKLVCGVAWHPVLANDSLIP